MLSMVTPSSLTVTATGPAKPCALALQEPSPSVVAEMVVETVAASSASGSAAGTGCGSSGVSSVAA